MKSRLMIKYLSAITIIILTAYVITLFSTVAFASVTKIVVTPKSNAFNADLVPVNSTFSINVSVIDGVNIWNWQVNFTFDPTMLECVEAIIPANSPFAFPVAPDPVIDNVNGYVLMGASKIGATPGVNASGVLATITLKIIKAPTTSTPLTCTLNLTKGTRLKDNKMQEIPVILEPGYYQYYLDEVPPQIDTPTQVPPPDNVLVNQDVKVMVNVTDDISGVKTVILSYNLNNEPQRHNVTMSFNETSGLWEGVIPGQPYGTQVKYFIIAYDNAGNMAVNNNLGSYFAYITIPELSSVFSLVFIGVSTTVIAFVAKRKKLKTN